MGHNKRAYKFYVVDVQTIAIDSGWEHREDALDRGVALKQENGGTQVKVMTKPAVGTQVLDPNDDASWSPKRANPSDGNIVVGTYWRQKARDPHNSVFKVIEFDGRKVTFRNVLHGDVFTLPLEKFVAQFTQGGENPASVVKTARDRRLWESAKTSAEKQGREGDWQYVMGIFTRMKERTGGTLENPHKPPGRHGGLHPKKHRTSGYTQCACPSCNDVAVSNDVDKPSFCALCKEAKCSRTGDTCQRADAMDDLLENPGELLIVNGEPDSAKAEKVFTMWHKKDPRTVSTFRPGVDGDDNMVCIGNANDIVYRSGKWEKGRKTNDYVHTFDSKPKVWMLAHIAEPGLKRNGEVSGSKSVESLLAKSRNADGQFAVADLAAPLSFSVDGEDGPEEIAVHSGARVYGCVDKRTVIIVDPHWKLIVIKGGEMRFDERGIVK